MALFLLHNWLSSKCNRLLGIHFGNGVEKSQRESSAVINCTYIVFLSRLKTFGNFEVLKVKKSCGYLTLWLSLLLTFQDEMTKKTSPETFSVEFYCKLPAQPLGGIYDLCRCREHPTYGQFPPSVAGMEHLHRLYDPLLKWTLYPDFPMRKPFWSLKDLLHIQFSFDKSIPKDWNTHT